MKTYPLLQSQLGVLLQSMQHPESTQYNLPICIFMPLAMNRQRVALVVQRLVSSIPELHTRFVLDGQDEIRQWSDMSMQIPVVSRQSTEAELQAYIHDGFIRPFNPFGGEPLFRTEVVATEKGVWLLADGHHTIVDGMSLTPVLTRAFAKIAEGKGWEGLPPFGMYQAAEAEVASFGSEAYQRAKDYFARKFTGLQMATLSWGRYGEPGPMGRVTAIVGRSRCEEWCREYSVNPSHLFQAAFSYVMSVLTREEQVAFTAENHGRGDRRLLGCVGMFVKTIPMLIDANPACRVIDFVRSQREELKEAISHIDYPFTHFCRDLGLKPGVTFNFMAVKGMEERVQFGAARFRVVQPVRNEIDSDLSVSIYTKGDDYEIRVESSLAMNDEATLRMVAEAMKVTVGSMMAHPEQTLGGLDIVSTDEREALIALGRGKQIAVDPQMTFVKAFEQCASRVPDNIAVADADITMTYGELSRRSDILAQRLIASGVCPDDFVAVRLDRTIEFPLAVIAIHKAGAAYVPIDLEYPEERQQYMLADCQAKLVIDEQFMAGIDFTAEASPVDLSSPAGLAYMIYTSGSTGRPKGVMIHQAGLWNFINMVIDMEHLTADDRISLHRSFSFDAHIQDMYPILTLGGSLHIMAENIRMDLAAIRNFLFEHQITGGGYATPMATLLLNTYDDLPVRFMTVGGEKLAGVYSDHIEIINAYGPTECTDDTSYYVIPPGYRARNIPIGKSVANCYNFITDRCGRLLPRGAVGELCFAGIQVGRGYWRRPELTAEKFVACPFLSANEDGQPVRMYRTGDLCRWNADGELEYIGRIDNQVKLHGYRIELGEIEACASRIEGISQAVAEVRLVKGSDTLCLYYTVSAGSAVGKEALNEFLSQKLANYMVPTAYMQMDALPTTPNGKVDRRRLPEPEYSLLHTDYVAPRNELERLIVGSFEKVLEQDNISIHDDFVHLGGDSLKAIKVILSLGKSGITVADVLNLRTPAAIAGHTEELPANLDKYTIESGCPLNNSQMFIFNDILKFGKYDSYLIPSLIPIDAKYTDEQIRRALDMVFTAHPVLTMHVAMRDGVPYMEKGDKPAVMKGSLNPLKVLSLLMSGFDLYTSLSRHIILRILGKCYLLSVFHHLIFDVVSEAVFCRHFQRALEGGSLDFVDDHFLRVSAFHQEVKSTERYAEMDKYIRAMLGNLTEGHFYRNPGKRGRPGYHKRELGVSREQVQRAADSFGITKNILFTAAMAMTLSKLAGSDDVAFGFLDNGRDRFRNFEDLGLYITGMPLVVHVERHDMRAFLDHLTSVYNKLRQNNYFPFASLVQEFNIAPIILFQFFPDWILEDGKYNHLPKNEMIINRAVSTQKDFMVEALVDVSEIGDSYFVRIMYSGYYSRKMMKALAATYKETLSEMLKV